MEKEGKRVKILFTGFEPFGGSCENPSYDCLKGLPCTVGETELVTANLPVSFRRARALLLERMGEERPDAVVCLGLAAGRKKISLEKVGINYAHAQIPDNDGDQPVDTLLDPNGPAAYFSGLPVLALAEALNREEIPAEVSLTAGSYVCNCLLYRLLARAGGIPAGFIHVPAAQDLPLEVTAHAMERTAAFLTAWLERRGVYEI